MTCIITNQSVRRRKFTGLMVTAAAALLCCACAASRPPDPGAPRTAEPPYPIVVTASDERRQRALDVWRSITGGQRAAAAAATTTTAAAAAAGDAAAAPELQPVTATLTALPQTAAEGVTTTPLYLPKVGGGANDAGRERQTEEETRESLRRFIAAAAPLLGVDLLSLSLIEVSEESGGIKRARYRQRSFQYPLRAGYGLLEIAFAPDRRVVQLSSTAIPDAERIARAIANTRPRLTASEAAQRVANRPISYTTAAGGQQTVMIPAAVDQLEVRELVIYPRPATANDGATLELHLAWEVAVNQFMPRLLFYVDAVTGETLAATTPAASGDEGATAGDGA